IEGSGETKDLTEDDMDVNSYTREKFKADNVLPLVTFGFNVDDGLFLGGGFLSTKFGWRKTPHASDHKFQGAVAAKTGAFSFQYSNNLYQVLRKWDITTNLNVLAPQSATNFYGLGNETNKTTDDFNFYLVRFNNVKFYSAFQRRFDEKQTLKFGPQYEYVDVELDANRFIGSDAANIPETAFESTHLPGVKIEYLLNTTDNKVVPTKGIKVNGSADWLYNTTLQKSLNRIQGNFCFYTSLNTKFPVTFATRFGGATNFGDYEFYQANTLGSQNIFFGQDNMRGFNRDRYSGRSSAYNNTEIRIKLFDFRSYLFPGQFGIFGFADHGRVWIDSESSNLWHNSYGGGLWISPMQQVVITGTYANSNEDQMITLNASFLF
ncbi:MAG: BamA/TamA family outer membrane protein, partial [Flavobacteriales bacterium]|nr:BamA/TamA family outer membrane protein [Flavobacteriales bacterium]